MYRSFRLLKTTAGCLLGISLITLLCPIAGWTAASAGSPMNPSAQKPLTTFAPEETDSSQSNEARAEELANSFFGPLLEQAKKDADRASLLHQRGVLYLRSGCKRQAITDLNEAVRLMPKKSEERYDLLFHRACALLMLPTPDGEAAIADLSLCIAAHPDDAEALFVRATAYKLLHKAAQARADFARADALAPKSDTGIRAMLRQAQEQPR